MEPGFEFTNDIREYVIDLGAPPDMRWAHLLERAAERAEMRALVDLGWKEFLRKFEGADDPGFFRRVLRQLFVRVLRIPDRAAAIYEGLYSVSSSRHKDEIFALADALDVDRGKYAALQNMYTFSQLAGRNYPKKRRHPDWCLMADAACTSGIVWIEGKGMVHLRTLDWADRELGHAISRATRLFHFRDSQRPGKGFTVVGISNHVSGFSALAPGRFSITINWAPPQVASPRMYVTPDTLLREVMETCGTYQEAVDTIMGKKELSSSAFFMVCGVKKGEGCVIEASWIETKHPGGLAEGQSSVHFEMKKRDFDVKKGCLVQANHYIALATGQEPTIESIMSTEHTSQCPKAGANSGSPLNRAVYQAECFDRNRPDICKSLLGSSRLRQRKMESLLPELTAEMSLARMLDHLKVQPILNPETRHYMAFEPASGEYEAQRLVVPEAVSDARTA